MVTLCLGRAFITIHVCALSRLTIPLRVLQLSCLRLQLVSQSFKTNAATTLCFFESVTKCMHGCIFSVLCHVQVKRVVPVDIFQMCGSETW